MDRESFRVEIEYGHTAGGALANEAPRVSLSSEDDTNHVHSHFSDLDENQSVDGEVKRHPKKNKLRALKSKTKAKTKALLHLDHTEPSTVEADRENGGALSDIVKDPAFNPTNVIEEAGQEPTDSRGPVDKTVSRLKSIGTTVAHPRIAIQKKALQSAAGTLSSVQRPQLSQGADEDLLDAHDGLARASKYATSDEDGSDADARNYKEKIERMEEKRESLRVAWTTKHIDRVRIVPRVHMQYPRETFIERDATGAFVRYKWEKWLGCFLIYQTQNFTAQYVDDFEQLPFDIDRLRDQVERIVIVSAPWQKWLMHIRHVYRWEDPKWTAMWLLVYLVVWYYQHLMGFVFGYILYLVIRNRYFANSYKSLRESEARSKAREGTAYNLGELMRKHGGENWLEPLIEELGPFIQLQLGDIANMLEVFAKSAFYAWKSPRKTAHTLIIFASCLLISVCMDMVFIIKGLWFLVGCCFFICWPISSWYPKYRYLVSPIKWVMWNIPTDAEWAFEYLRSHAQVSRQKLLERNLAESTPPRSTNPKDPSISSITTHPGPSSATLSSSSNNHSAPSPTSALSPTDLLSFRANHNSHAGKLLIHTTGLRFLRTATPSSPLNIPYASLLELRKIDNAISKVAKISGMLPRRAKESGEDLELRISAPEAAEGPGQGGGEGHAGGEFVLLKGVEDRDEVFNAIIGFSGGRWQSLQSGPVKRGDERGSGRGKGSLWGDLGTMGVG